MRISNVFFSETFYSAVPCPTYGPVGYPRPHLVVVHPPRQRTRPVGVSRLPYMTFRYALTHWVGMNMRQLNTRGVLLTHLPPIPLMPPPSLL